MVQDPDRFSESAVFETSNMFDRLFKTQPEASVERRTGFTDEQWNPIVAIARNEDQRLNDQRLAEIGKMLSIEKTAIIVLTGGASRSPSLPSAVKKEFPHHHIVNDDDKNG